jgi:hypothetical protein
MFDLDFGHFYRSPSLWCTGHAKPAGPRLKIAKYNDRKYLTVELRISPSVFRTVKVCTRLIINRRLVNF